MGLSFISCESEKPKEETRPNIIFIMSDDHAVDAISSYGNSINQTPNIDRLAEEGVIFNSSFVTNSICAPSRAVMLTGKYSHLNGHVDNLRAFDGSQQTFPKLMQENNYQTALVGKWHLISEPTGFDYWNILPGQGNYYNPDFIEMGTQKKVDGYVTNLITDYSINWMENRDTTKPFCLLVHHKAPHRVWMPGPEHLNDFDSVEMPLPDKFFDDYKNRGTAAKTQKMSIWKDMYLGYDLKLSKDKNSTEIMDDLGSWAVDRLNPEQRKNWDKAYAERNKAYHQNPPQGKDLAIWKYNRYMQDYLGTIQSVDESVGDILDYLDKNGLAENTIIVYTSDQGFYLGEHGWFDKRFMYEQSLRMPLLIRYPKEIKKAVSEDMVMNIDFAPTFLDYAGIEIPKDIQGESMRDILAGKEDPNWREEVYYHYYEYPEGGHDVKRHYGIRTDRYKLIHFYYDIDEWELFDLEEDPNEMNNLFEHPEYQEVVKDMKQRLENIRVKYGDNNQDDFLPREPIEEVENLATGANVQYHSSYSPKYRGGGSSALIDGIKSIENLYETKSTNAWQGFEEQDVLVEIELKEETEINEISAGFMHFQKSWVFLPEWVEFSISIDGKDFQSLGKLTSEISRKSGEKQRLAFSQNLSGQKAKFIKLQAKNIGVCPEWHQGAGGKAWLFIDEIIVK
jgi:arylsulfatase A-like enzyme